MTVAGRAVLPTARGLFGDTDGTVRALRDDVDRALAALPAVDAFVLLAAGDQALVHDASAAELTHDGTVEIRADLRHDEALLGALAARGQTPRIRDDRLTGDLGALAVLVTAVQPQACVQPVTVPRAAGREALEAAAAGLVGAVRATRRRVVLVAAGDLARRQGADDLAAAVAWDRAAVAAVADGDLDAIACLGPGAASTHGASGWAPLAVLLGATSGAGPFARVGHHVVDGAGRLVAGESTATDP